MSSAALTRAELAAELRRVTFPPRRRGDRWLGAEVEMLPIDVRTRRICPIVGGDMSSLRMLRAHGRSRGWREDVSGTAGSAFRLPGGGKITFEPGGQLEYSSPPCASASALLANLREVVVPLVAHARDQGVELMSVGIDPENDIDCAPLQVRGDRYCRMAEYFATIGPAGARMMRQTAAFQMSVDYEDELPLRWRMLNALVPYVIAIFANSSRCAGADTGHRSYRAHVWRSLDPSRTGVLADGDDPAERYLQFALDAPAMLLGDETGYESFAQRAASGVATLEDWQRHLTTLFPEVRPRGYLEVRSADALAPHWYAAPVVLVAGLVYDRESLCAAAELVGDADESLLVRAGERALGDDGIRRTATALAEVAVGGCERIGPRLIDPSDLEIARDFFARYTWRGRSPADDGGKGKSKE